MLVFSPWIQNLTQWSHNLPIQQSMQCYNTDDDMSQHTTDTKKKTQSNCGYSSHQLGTGHKSVLTDGNVEQRLSLGRCHFDVKYAASVGKADYAEDIRSSALHCHCSLLLSAAINSTNLTVLTTVSLPVNVITGSSANYLRQWLVNN